MLQLDKSESNKRLIEVRRIFGVIKQLEAPDPTTGDSIEAKILRGLFYVHLYGALEYSVNLGIQGIFAKISSSGVRYAELDHHFYALALDQNFSSLKDSSKGKKWLKRIEFLDRQKSEDKCLLNDTVFGLELQNISSAVLKNVFLCLSLPLPTLLDSRLGTYVNELVEKRNAVAHGRESPAQVGSNMRSPDLKTRLDAITEVIDGLFICFEQYLSNYQYVSAAYRSKYMV